MEWQLKVNALRIGRGGDVVFFEDLVPQLLHRFRAQFKYIMNDLAIFWYKINFTFNGVLRGTCAVTTLAAFQLHSAMHEPSNTGNGECSETELRPSFISRGVLEVKLFSYGMVFHFQSLECLRASVSVIAIAKWKCSEIVMGVKMNNNKKNQPTI